MNESGTETRRMLSQPEKRKFLRLWRTVGAPPCEPPPMSSWMCEVDEERPPRKTGRRGSGNEALPFGGEGEDESSSFGPGEMDRGRGCALGI